jgi:hypothetical protein
MITLPKTFNAAPPSSTMQIEVANEALNFSLPADYIRFMLVHDGGEGFVGEHYLILWKASELKLFNDEYEIAVYARGLVAFGSNGGGEAFAFDTRVGQPTVVIAPFIGMSLDDATPVAPSFSDFLERLKSNARSYWEG